MKGTIGSFLTGIIIIAVLFVMVRPNSQGPKLVSSVTNGLGGLLRNATGGGAFTASGK